MKAPLLDPAFVWNSAASHSDSEAFRARQLQRQRDAQRKPEPANVQPIRKPRAPKVAGETT